MRCPNGSSAGGHHNHDHGGVAEGSETKTGVEAVLSTGGKHEHGHEQLHSCIGVSLVLGFVFMLLVDQIGSSHVHSPDGQSVHSVEMLIAFFFFCLFIIKLSLLFNWFRSRVCEGGLLKNHHHPGPGGPRCRWDTHWFTTVGCEAKIILIPSIKSVCATVCLVLS